MTTPDLSKIIDDSWPGVAGILIGTLLAQIFFHRRSDIRYIRRLVGRALNRFAGEVGVASSLIWSRPPCFALLCSQRLCSRRHSHRFRIEDCSVLSFAVFSSALAAGYFSIASVNSFFTSWQTKRIFTIKEMCAGPKNRIMNTFEKRIEMDRSVCWSTRWLKLLAVVMMCSIGKHACAAWPNIDWPSPPRKPDLPWQLPPRKLDLPKFPHEIPKNVPQELPSLPARIPKLPTSLIQLQRLGIDPTKILSKNPQEIARSITGAKELAVDVGVVVKEAENAVGKMAPTDAVKGQIGSFYRKVFADVNGVLELTQSEWDATRVSVDIDEMRKTQEILGEYMTQMADAARFVYSPDVWRELSDAWNKAQRQMYDLSQAINFAEFVQSVNATLEPLKADIEGLLKLRSEWKWVNLNDRMIDLLDQQIRKQPVFEIITPMDLSYNVIAQTYFAQVRLPQGIKYDSEKLKSDVRGRPSLPNVNVVQNIAEAAGQVSFTYSSKREDALKRYEQAHPGNVYFASERWTEWASPSTVATSGVKLIFSGGERTQEVVDDVWNHVSAEFSDMIAWGEMQGINNWQSFSRQWISEMQGFVKRENGPKSAGELHVDWSPVEIDYAMHPSGSTPWSKLIVDKVIREMEARKGGKKVEYEEKHLGFGFEYRIDDVPTMSSEVAAKRFINLLKSRPATDAHIDAAITALSELFEKTFGREKGYRLRKSFESISNRRVMDEMDRLFYFEEKDLIEGANNGVFVIDFSKSDISERVARWAKRFTLTRDSSVTTEWLALDLRTGRIEARLNLYHRYKWPGIEKAIFDLEYGAKLYPQSDSLLKADAVAVLIKQLASPLSSEAQLLLEPFVQMEDLGTQIRVQELKLRNELSKMPSRSSIFGR